MAHNTTPGTDETDSFDTARAAAFVMRDAAPIPANWRTVDDVQPLLNAAALLVQVGDIDAALAILQPKVYDPNDSTSPINRLVTWSEWRLVARALEKVVAHEATITQPADRLAARLVLGTAYERLLEYPEAQPHLDVALDLARTLGNVAAECFILSRQGNIIAQTGNQQQALTLYMQALSLARRTGNRQGEGMLLNNIGSIHETLGQMRKAITFFEQAWKIAQRNHDNFAENWYTYSIAGTLVSMGDYAAALAFTARILPQVKRINMVTIRAELQTIRAECLWRLGNDAAAQELYNATIAFCQKNNLRLEQVKVYIGAAKFAYARGNIRKAHNLLNRAESDIALLIETGTSDADLFLPALNLRGHIARAEGNPERATAAYMRMREVSVLTSTSPFEAKAYLGLSNIACDAQNYQAAFDLLLRAYALMAESEHRVRQDIIAAFKNLAVVWPDFETALTTTTRINPVSQTLLQAEVGL